MRPLMGLALLMAIGCADRPGGGAAAVTVFAAVSLQTALDDIDARLLRPANHTVRLTYAGTPTLARQVEAGAPADIFISADDAWMDHLQRAGHIDATSRVTLAGNSLVLVVPSSSSTPVRLAAADLGQLLVAGRLSVADPSSVPAGRYTQEALVALGLWDVVKQRLAPHENVRAAVAIVARGEAPVGIVYASDAAAEPRVRVAARIPAESHAPIRYPAALVTGAPARAKAVFELLTSPSARSIFLRHGFSEPPTSTR